MSHPLASPTLLVIGRVPMPARLQEVHPMSDQAQTAHNVLSIVALSTGNFLAWAASVDIGAIATGITLVGLALIGVASQGIKVVGKSRAEAWAERMRTEMQIKADMEKLEAGSLTAQNKRLHATIEEMGAQLKAAIDADRERTEDANKKLHAMANERQTEVNRHHEEIERLTHQLELATKQLEETSNELHAARAQIRALLAKLENMQNQVSDNTADIKQIQQGKAS